MSNIIPVEEKNEIVLYKKKKTKFSGYLLSILKLIFELLKTTLFVFSVIFVIVNYKKLVGFVSVWADLLFIVVFCLIPLVCYFLVAPLMIKIYEIAKSFLAFLFKPKR